MCVFFRIFQSFSQLKSPWIGGFASPFADEHLRLSCLYIQLYIFPRISMKYAHYWWYIDSQTLSVESMILISKYHHGPIDCWYYPAISSFWVAKKNYRLAEFGSATNIHSQPTPNPPYVVYFWYLHQQKPAKIAALPPWWRTRTTLSSPGTKVASVASGLQSKRLANSSVRSTNPEKSGIETGKRWKNGKLN